MPQTEVWIAINPSAVQQPPPNTNIYGSGTQADPYDGSTSARFDAVMRFLADPPNGGAYLIHIRPGTFMTLGLRHFATTVVHNPWQPGDHVVGQNEAGDQGWNVRSNWTIAGAGGRLDDHQARTMAGISDRRECHVESDKQRLQAWRWATDRTNAANGEKLTVGQYIEARMNEVAASYSIISAKTIWPLPIGRSCASHGGGVRGLERCARPPADPPSVRSATSGNRAFPSAAWERGAAHRMTGFKSSNSHLSP